MTTTLASRAGGNFETTENAIWVIELQVEGGNADPFNIYVQSLKVARYDRSMLTEDRAVTTEKNRADGAVKGHSLYKSQTEKGGSVCPIENPTSPEERSWNDCLDTAQRATQKADDVQAFLEAGILTRLKAVKARMVEFERTAEPDVIAAAVKQAGTK